MRDPEQIFMLNSRQIMFVQLFSSEREREREILISLGACIAKLENFPGEGGGEQKNLIFLVKFYF